MFKDPRVLLTLGVLLRVLVFSFLSPENNDGHAVVKIHNRPGKIPLLSTKGGQSYHLSPYHLLGRIDCPCSDLVSKASHPTLQVANVLRRRL